jgi:PAS domain S-box-containing protein
MTHPNEGEEPSAQATQQVNDLFDSVELANAVETEEFKHFLDYVPIAIAVSKHLRGEQRIVYANTAFEQITGRSFAEIGGRCWTILDTFRHEDDEQLTFSRALQSGDEYLGTFRPDETESTLVEVFVGCIQNDDGTENYRTVALIDVTTRERAQREEFARQIRDRDMVLKEIQHRVKNNLQLVTALIRLEGRNERRGDKVDLDTLAGRIEALHLLYQALAPESLGDQIDLGNYLNKIAAAVMAAHGVEGIRLAAKVDHSPISVNIAMPLGLIVNELMTNSFKHAFRGRGRGAITLECLQDGTDRYHVVVADDGVGLPEGVVWPTPGKIGALVVKSLCDNTETMLRVESAPATGTRISISVVAKQGRRKPN